MKQKDKYKNDLEAQRMDPKLHLNDRLRNCPFAMDDALKKGLDALHPSQSNWLETNQVPKPMNHKGQWEFLEVL